MFKGIANAVSKLMGTSPTSASLGGGMLRRGGMTSRNIADMTAAGAAKSAAATMSVGTSMTMGRGFQMAARTNPVSFAQTNTLGNKLATHLDTIGGNMFRNTGGTMQVGPMLGSYQKTPTGRFFPSSFGVSGTGYVSQGMGRMMGGRLPNQMG